MNNFGQKKLETFLYSEMFTTFVKGKKSNKTRVDRLSWPKIANRYCSTGLRVFWWLKFEQELVNMEDRLQKG